MHFFLFTINLHHNKEELIDQPIKTNVISFASGHVKVLSPQYDVLKKKEIDRQTSFNK